MTDGSRLAAHGGRSSVDAALAAAARFLIVADLRPARADVDVSQAADDARRQVLGHIVGAAPGRPDRLRQRKKTFIIYGNIEGEWEAYHVVSTAGAFAALAVGAGVASLSVEQKTRMIVEGLERRIAEFVM